jgi:hypothetical protein
MKTAILYISLVFFISGSLGCKKEAKNKVKPIASGPYLYVGGGTAFAGVYWQTSLSQASAGFIIDTIAHAGFISSIVTSGSDVYIPANTAGYWKDNSFVPVTGAISISYLALSGADVYTAGDDNNSNLAYWKNNTETNIGSTIGRNLFPYQANAEFGLSGIAVSGNTAFVSGSLSFQNEPFAPNNAIYGNFGLLWDNGNVKLFGQGYLLSAALQETAGVAVSGSDVYVAGILPDTMYAGGYWKNGVWNSINNGLFQPTSIAAFGSDIYITGNTYSRTATTYSQQGAYWKNGSLVNFPLAGSVTAIAVNGTDTYVLGVDVKFNNNVIWKNGTLFRTLGPVSNQRAACLAIGN